MILSTPARSSMPRKFRIFPRTFRIYPRKFRIYPRKFRIYPRKFRIYPKKYYYFPGNITAQFPRIYLISTRLYCIISAEILNKYESLLVK